MSKDPVDSKEIDNYLSGHLSPEHLAEFEKRLKEEETVQEEVVTSKKVIEGLEGYAFKKMLKEIHSKLFGDPQT